MVDYREQGQRFVLLIWKISAALDIRMAEARHRQILPVAVWVRSSGAVLETLMRVVAMKRAGLTRGHPELVDMSTHVRTCHA